MCIFCIYCAELWSSGKAQSIGVSNYGIHHLEELFRSANVKPSVNQIELSPYLPRDELASFCQRNGIAVEAYSPLTQGSRLSDPRLVAIAEKYAVTPAQVLLQWCLQKRFITIPKSVNPGRISENADVLQLFPSDKAASATRLLSEEDLIEMTKWDEGLVMEWDPTVGL